MCIWLTRPKSSSNGIEHLQLLSREKMTRLQNIYIYFKSMFLGQKSKWIPSKNTGEFKMIKSVENQGKYQVKDKRTQLLKWPAEIMTCCSGSLCFIFPTFITKWPADRKYNGFFRLNIPTFFYQLIRWLLQTKINELITLISQRPIEETIPTFE